MTEIFQADFAKMGARIEAAGGVGTTSDGFKYVDVDVMGADFVATYNNFLAYGYANGLI